ncbi:uncharacterized protein [Lepeophtheirus salmonis]|uniref:uncharacterized protein n=1 Tax=Lepeophtheirus salmonis TaxID=72036 RepID=UPI001AEA0F6B|nr:uncharacterized protein LOC121120201 [Lepeophtheirus salmonis]
MKFIDITWILINMMVEYSWASHSVEHMHYNQSVRGKIIEYNQSIEFWSPYQNFSKFVCKGSNNPLEKAANVVTQQVLHILTHPSSEYPSRYYEAKKLFDSCTSIEKREYFGLKFFKKWLSETSPMGGYPIIYPNWKRGSFVVENLIIKFGFFSLFMMSRYRDERINKKCLKNQKMRAKWTFYLEI